MMDFVKMILDRLNVYVAPSIMACYVKNRVDPERVKMMEFVTKLILMVMRLPDRDGDVNVRNTFMVKNVNTFRRVIMCHVGWPRTNVSRMSKVLSSTI